MSSQCQAAQQLEGEHAEDQPGKRGDAEAGENRAAGAGPADERADHRVVDQEGRLQDKELRWRRT